MLFTVPPGRAALRIFFREPAPDTSYVASARPDWNTKVTLANKKVYGFVVRFKTVTPPEGGVVSIDVPGFQIYNAAQMVHEQNQRVQQAWRQLQTNRSSDLARQLEEQIREVRSRPEIVIVRRRNITSHPDGRIYHCNYCGAEGQGIQWARIHHHQTSQTTLSIEQPQRKQAKKKTPQQDVRLNALVNASVGGQ